MGQFVVQLVKARDLLLILVLQRPWLTEVGLGFIKLLMQASKALLVVTDKLSDVIHSVVNALNTAGHIITRFNHTLAGTLTFSVIKCFRASRARADFFRFAV